MDYLNDETGEWETFDTVIQRRNIGDERAQAEFIFDRLNFQTKMIRVHVTRTVDDVIVNKILAEPGDKVIDQRKNPRRQIFPPLSHHATRNRPNPRN